MKLAEQRLLGRAISSRRRRLVAGSADDDCGCCLNALLLLLLLPVNMLMAQQTEGRRYIDAVGQISGVIDTTDDEARRGELKHNGCQLGELMMLTPAVAQQADGRNKCGRPADRQWERGEPCCVA